jgi:hypothetical protein
VAAGSGGAVVSPGLPGDRHGALDLLPWWPDLVFLSTDLCVWRRQRRHRAAARRTVMGGQLVRTLELPSPVFGGVGGVGAAPAVAAGHWGFGLDLRSYLLQCGARRVSDGCFGSTMVVGLG